jgi:hypothetical protein
MTHQELQDSASLYALDALDGPELAAFESHLVECEACRAAVASYREVAGLLAYAAPPARPANEAALRDRVLRSARQVQPIAAAPSLRAAPPARPWRRHALGLAWTAAAASVALAIVSGLGYRRAQDERDRLVTQLVSAREELAQRDSTIASFLGPEVHVVSLRDSD